MRAFLALLKDMWENDKYSAKKEQMYYILSAFSLSFGTDWSSVGVRHVIEFDFLGASASEAAPAIPVPGVCCAEVPVGTLREDPNLKHQFLSHLRHNIAGKFQEHSWSHLVIWNAL